jgi:hypothetical protein
VKKINLVSIFMLVMLLAMSTGLMADGVEPTGNPRQVSTLDNLLWISTNISSWGDDFIQTANIDASATSSWNMGVGFSPIGDATINFTGNYNGDSYTITGLYINDDTASYIGLFGWADSATIENLSMINVNINGDAYVGGLLGYGLPEVTINNCFSSGSVTGDDRFAGGLAGRIHSNSHINNSYSSANVTGNDYVGGIAGVVYDYSTVNYSYSTGVVNGTSHVGGLIGTAAYYSDINNSFWDTQTSGQASSSGGTGKTTAEMKTQSTFTDAGWDFSTPVWNIDGTTNDGYPFLNWQEDNPLPVNLSAFYALYIGEIPTLYWTTQSEENNAYWNVYRATSDNFTTAALLNANNPVPGNGTINSASDYIYVDILPVVQNANYWYWIEDVSIDGETEVHDPITLSIPFEDTPVTPENYGLQQNYPNPFNPSTSISFALSEESDVELIIYNVKGEKINTIFNDHIYADQVTTAVWDGNDINGKQVSTGIYLYKLITETKEYSKKMLMVK